MNLSLKKYKLFDYVLLLLPIIDVLNTVFATRLSLVVRSLILAFFIFYLLFINKSKNKKIYLIIFFVICFFAASYLIHNYFINGLYNIKNEIISMVKFVYLPLLTLCMYAYYENKKLNISDIISKIGYLYSFFIAIPTVLGFGLKSYDLYKLGYSGLFHSPNEVGNILAIVFPFVIFNLFNNRKSILNYVLVCIFIISCFILGTKTPFIGLVLTIFASFVIFLVRILFIKNNKRNSKQCFVLIILLAIFTFVCYQNSYLKMNLNLQDYNYSDIITVPEKNNDDKQEGTGNTENSGTEQDGYGNNENINLGTGQTGTQSNGNDILISSDLPNLNFNTENINFPNKEPVYEVYDNKLLNMIFSSRNVYLQNNLSKMKLSSFSHKLLGITTGNSANMSELDFCDIFIYYGIIGLFILCGYLLIIFIKVVIKILITFTTSIMNNDLLATFVSFSLGLLIALTAGHTLSAPAVSFFVAIDIVYLIKTLKLRTKLFENKKIGIILITVFILITFTSLIFIEKNRYNLAITFSNDSLLFNNEVNITDEREIEYDDIKDEMTYYTTNIYRNINIVYVLRTFGEESKIKFITLNNNGFTPINVELENEKYSRVYIYRINNKDVKSFNERMAKTLINIVSTDNKITLNPGESIDAYYIDIKEEIRFENVPWLTYKGIYSKYKDNLYLRDLANKKSDYKIELLDKNYLLYLNSYSANFNGIVYKDLFLYDVSKIRFNNVYFDMSLNYNVYRKLLELDIENKMISNLVKLVISDYDKEYYFRTNEGIIFNNLVIPTLKEQIAIANVFIENYKELKDNEDKKVKKDKKENKNDKILKIIEELLGQICSDNWYNDKGELYEFMDYGLIYIGEVKDIEILENIAYLYDNLKKVKELNKYDISDKIEYLINKFGIDNLNDEQKNILKEGGFIE